MVELLDTTAKITSEIQTLIRESKGEKLMLITPYVQIARQFKTDIEDLTKFRTTITVIVREGENHNPKDVSFLQEMSGVSLWTLPNLHAKCYLNHKSAIIASMNLYEYSQVNNTEIGVLISRENDSELYDQVYETIQRIHRESHEYEFEIVKKSGSLKDAKPEYKKNTMAKSPSKKNGKPETGYCIRCGKSMPFNPDKPLCDNCYPIWAKYGDKKYSEKYCHICGKDVPSHKSSYEKPVCYPCYKKYLK